MLPLAPQYILWQRTADGRKLPVSPRTLAVINPHDRSHWTDHATAASAAAVSGYHLAFVLAESDDRWFLDVDHCLISGAWSQTAVDLCAALPGAYVEVSQSGEGLHLLGRGRLPPHGTRNSALGLELYSGLRFVALTGTGATGNAETDLTAAINGVATRYFTPSTKASPNDWSDQPRPDWSGPDDDDELIERMFSWPASAAASFGDGVTFRDLWEGNTDALAQRWPTPTADERPYDASSADAALAQHLAFATGCNHARMERMMRGSALARDKWDRTDYLTRTITRAVGLQREVYQDRSAAAAATPEAAGPAASGVAAAAAERSW